MTEVTVKQMEEYISQQKTLVVMRDAAITLADNKHFKKLILDGFCTTEAARYVQESGDPMLSAEMRADALAMAQASGHLKRFLQITIQLGNTAANNIRGAEEQIDLIREEGGDA